MLSVVPCCSSVVCILLFVAGLSSLFVLVIIVFVFFCCFVLWLSCYLFLLFHRFCFIHSSFLLFVVVHCFCVFGVCPLVFYFSDSYVFTASLFH